jgi:hypothetical protein
MAIISNTYTGDGVTTLFTFSFPYIDPIDVYVKVDDTDLTPIVDWIFSTGSTIQILTPPAVGAVIDIYRQTQEDILKASFFPGSAIRAKDLNDNFLQGLYLSQESADLADSATISAEQASQAAQQAANDAAQAAADAASATADAASATADAANAQIAAANAASAAADAASDAADASTSSSGALIAAQEAVSTANGAEATANSADTKADSALSLSQGADTKSDQAINTANSAVVTANAASSNASQAIAKAEEAQVDADLAVEISSKALTIADGVAQSGEPFGQLYNTTSGAAGSKVIDLGDLTTIGSVTDHFDNETNGVSKYTCSEGSGIYSLGSV